MNAVVRILVWLYRRALLRYPKRFRNEYGEEMVRAFEAELRSASGEHGWSEMLRKVWMLGIDLARPLPALRRGGGGSNGGGDLTGHRGTGSRRRVRGAGWTDDARHAWRSLRRDPRFSGLVVGVLGVGIALFVAVFAVVNAYLLRPLPFPDADRIVNVQGTRGAVGWMEVGEVFEKAVSWDLDVFIMVGDGPAQVTNGAWVTADYLEVYGIEPALGRTFTVEEAVPGGPQVAMISHRLWQERFGGSPAILGSTFRAFTSDRPDHAGSFTVVGVLPEDFWYFNEYTDVLVPIRENRAVYTGLLRADIPRERAEAVIDELARAGLETVPADFRVELVGLQEQHTASVRPRLILFQAAVLLVLVIACANAAVLLLVRSLRRNRELGVRRALGADRWRLARQLLLEGVFLALGAGAVGAVLAALGLRAVQEAVPAQLGTAVPGGSEALAVDPFVLASTVGICALAGAFFGAVPYLATQLRSGRVVVGGDVRGGSESRRTRRFRAAMVVVEVALSLALLVGAGLMVRSAFHLQRMELGFDPERLERGVVGLRAADYPTADSRAAFFDLLLERTRALPGVESAGLVNQAPFTGRVGAWDVESEVGRAAETKFFRANESYFRTMGTQLRAGRVFERSDREGTPGVAVVSESLAEALWPDRNPLGERFRWPDAGEDGGPTPWVTVVGVVEDITNALDEPVPGSVFLSNRQEGSTWMNLVVRLREGATPVMPRVETIVRELDSEAPLSSVTWLEDAVDRALVPVRFTGGILTVFSGLSALLAVVGLYGVVSYSARQGVRDVAIRMALGADRGRAVRPLLKEGVVVVVVGVILGLAAAALLGGVLGDQLAGVSARDPLTHGAVAGGLLLLALAAVWLPVRRAARVQPMGVLREE